MQAHSLSFTQTCEVMLFVIPGGRDTHTAKNTSTDSCTGLVRSQKHALCCPVTRVSCADRQMHCRCELTANGLCDAQSHLSCMNRRVYWSCELTVNGPCAAQLKTLVQQLEQTSSLASAVSLARSSRSNWGMKTVLRASLRVLSRTSFQALAVVLTLWVQYSSLICSSKQSAPCCSGMSGRLICRHMRYMKSFTAARTVRLVLFAEASCMQMDGAVRG